MAKIVLCVWFDQVLFLGFSAWYLVNYFHISSLPITSLPFQSGSLLVSAILLHNPAWNFSCVSMWERKYKCESTLWCHWWRAYNMFFPQGHLCIHDQLSSGRERHQQRLCIRKILVCEVFFPFSLKCSSLIFIADFWIKYSYIILQSTTKGIVMFFWYGIGSRFLYSSMCSSHFSPISRTLLPLFLLR